MSNEKLDERLLTDEEIDELKLTLLSDEDKFLELVCIFDHIEALTDISENRINIAIEMLIKLAGNKYEADCPNNTAEYCDDDTKEACGCPDFFVEDIDECNKNVKIEDCWRKLIEYRTAKSIETTREEMNENYLDEETEAEYLRVWQTIL